MRGLPAEVSTGSNADGITPACAGTTPPYASIIPIFEDHPRLCGDYLSITAPLSINSGSPPPVRGLLEIETIAESEIGITPACAGTTCLDVYFSPIFRDHPRLCGDYVPILRGSRDS